MLYFVTGNKSKYEEAKLILPNIKQLDIDLPEIQEIDSKKIVGHKLQEAGNQIGGAFIVEDTSLYLDCLGGLPGPFIKWFLKTMGREGIYEVCEKLGNYKAVAKTIIGYSNGKGEIYFFEGMIEGIIVQPDSISSFGWDPLFLPNGYDETFAQMEKQKKISISMRTKVLEKLKKFLQEKNENKKEAVLSDA